MKRALIISLLCLVIVAANAQPKTRGKVKRKYRNVERVSENLPQVIFRGLVRDVHKIPIPGASIEIEGIKRLVHSNEFGQFMLTDLPTGRLRLKIACIGYRTKTIDFMLQAGFNDHYVALDRELVHLEPMISIAQKREQQIPDVPASLSVVTPSFADQLHITGFEGLAAYMPWLSFEEAGEGKAGFSIRGSMGNAGISTLSPSVALFSDEVPVVRPAGMYPLFFDMERVEVLNGPQNSLFGRNALAGAVHVISKKPHDRFDGYFSAGGGNYGTKEARGAVNVPVIKNKLFARAAGVYSATDGYVENAPQGKLNGNSRYGGRFSLRFLPAFNHKLDITLNYLNDEHSGVAFRNPWYEDWKDDAGEAVYHAFLNRGKELGSQQELIDGTLNYRYFINEHDYWTVISSYRKSRTTDAWDADGTSLPALEMDDEQKADLFYQEIRYNFSKKSRLNGSAGLSYSRETSERRQEIASNDQLIYDILSAPGNFVMPAQNRFPVNPQPLNPSPMAGFSLSDQHHEELLNEQIAQSAQAYLHFTYRLNQLFFFTGGVRAFYDRMQLNHESLFTGGAESSLGQFTQSKPNLLYQPSESQQLTENNLSVVGEAGITYRWNENFNFFVNVKRGRKPQVLQFTWDSRPLVAEAETVNSAEAGWKTRIKQRVFWDVTGFYSRHEHVQTVQWGGSAGTAMVSANGKASSYGAETGLKAALIKGVEVFGNYAWMLSAYDSTGVNGNLYEYAGNSFARAPEHSFSAGLTAGATVIQGMRLFVTPWYAWKSHFWFTDANTPGLEQDAFGLLNVNAGVEFDNPAVEISIYGNNLLEEKYISTAGHWGGLLGMPTEVPGAPRRLGAKVTWRF